MGCGEGTKFGLVHKMAALHQPSMGESVLVVDDDVLLDRGTLADLLVVGVPAGLDLAQAGHSARSYWSHPITIARLLVRMRLTNFVAIGPLFAILPGAHRLLTELPDDKGWGYELECFEQWRAGRLRRGIIDCVRMTACGAGCWGIRDGGADGGGLWWGCGRAGFRSWRHLQRTQGTWSRWRAGRLGRQRPLRFDGTGRSCVMTPHDQRDHGPVHREGHHRPHEDPQGGDDGGDGFRSHHHRP